MATGNVFLYRMGAGFPGAVNREVADTAEPNIMDVTNPPLAYGDPVKMGSNGKIQALQAGDTNTAIYGFLIRPFPTQQVTYPAQPFGTTTPLAGGQCTIMKRGYMTVAVQGVTVPPKGGPVYVRVAGTLPTNGRYNGLEALVDGTPANTPLVGNLPDTYFMGAPDSNGITEIAYKM